MERSDRYSGTAAKILPSWEERELSGDFTQVLKKRSSVDVPFLLLTLIIMMIGVVMVLSASFPRAYYTQGRPLNIFIRQLIFAGTGIILMFITSRFSAKTMRGWSMALLAVSIVLLAAVPFIGEKVNGARRWINLGFTNFQPSEITKLAVIMSFAAMICKYDRKMGTFKYGVAPFGIIIAIILGLLYLEPHISAMVIIIALAAIMMFAGGTRLIWFILAGVMVFAVAGIVIFSSVKEQNAAADAVQQTQETQQESQSGRTGYASRRISAWLDPESDPLGKGFQIRQSLFAVGSGGLFGQGLGQSRQKYLYLPEEHNDYIFAIVCEELGFIGAMLILLLFALLVVRGYWLALHTKDRYSSLVVTGITSLLAIQVFLNVAVVTNLVPSTGISLPFFSYGGTALWIQLVEMGIILAISRDIPLTKAG